MDRRDKIAEIVWEHWTNGNSPEKFEDTICYKYKCGFPYVVTDGVIKIDKAENEE